ncbi:MAG TPA: UvrD-helicase domain-containing protein [Rickettsiales bacterium]|nr:UvrD-helicase domain-containing protein [Rickettsiales bacterium]
MQDTLESFSDTSGPLPIIAKLNPEQRAAVMATEGPVLVLAGAGTGKTRVLTTRIAHILSSRRAWPGQILAVTFTNKAAREMGERVEALLHGNRPQETEGGVPNRVSSLNWLGTFHSIAAKILRRHAEVLGFTSSFTILNADDQLRLIKQLSNDLGVDEKQNPAKQMLGIIQSWKDQGLVPEKISVADVGHGAGAKALLLYRAYQDRLKTLNAMDFGDLLLHNLTLFTEHPEIHKEIAGRFKYILVDEYQDTNVAQYLWLRLLAVGHKNICCVGDDDQSIYGWRGAEIGNILKFEKDFPGATVVRLERNYRSTGNILGAASQLIAHNTGRLGKTLWTEDDEGDKVRVCSLWDGDEEARFVGEETEAFQRSGSGLNDIAVLVRAGFQTRAFEERFLLIGVGYRVIGGLRFYERQEIRDAIAYLRIVSQPDDDLAFERIINTPRRGIGAATLEAIHSFGRAENISMTRATARLIESGKLKGKVAAALSALLSSFDRWRGLLGQQSIGEITDLVLDESGYRQMWKQETTPDAQGRLENLKELVRAMGEFETLTAFLEHVGLVMDMAEDSNGDMVSIMTLHAAKGLEFDHVFLPGWEEGLFPHQRSVDESGREGLEEERRLAYVGITRARKTCTISFAGSRRMYNQWQSNIPSRFLSELPKEHIEIVRGM